MGFSVSLHVNDTELNVGARELALREFEEAREVILDKGEKAAQAAFDEVAQELFPVPDIFAAVSNEASQDALGAVAMEADSD